MRRFLALLLVTLAAKPALGQSEDAIRSYFEGKTVHVKIEMPGSDDGVDLYPGTTHILDFAKHTGRLKKFGTAYHPGDAALVTKVRVKGDHIEFQLGAGGYGTAGDNTSTTVDAVVTPKSQREKDLEQSVKTETDATRKKHMNEELDDLRTSRQREDARNASRAAEATAIREATLRQKRLDGGSRFNIRYDHDVPATALTPEAVQAALADYVDFAGGSTTLASAPMSGANAGTATPAAGRGDLKKGMLIDEVDALLGRPESITSRREGTLTVSTSSYRTRDRKVMAEFVEGVLIRFSVMSQ